MKRVNVRNGLKQRVNEILGTDSGTDTPPEITPWSIQAAMINNLRRIVTALVGDIGLGRPMQGLWLSQVGGTSFNISAGFGFTKNGDIIMLEVGVNVSLTDTAPGDKYIYLKHQMAEVDGDLYPDGKNTNFIGKTGYENIVYDDYAASKKTDLAAALDPVGDPLVIQSTQTVDNDYVYLGYITVAGSVITGITNSDVRGIAPNTPGGAYKIPSAEVTGNVTVGGNMTVEGQILADIIKAEEGSVVDFQDDVQFTNKATFSDEAALSGAAGKVTVGGTPGVTSFGPAAVVSITVKNGIITAIS